MAEVFELIDFKEDEPWLINKAMRGLPVIKEIRNHAVKTAIFKDAHSEYSSFKKDVEQDKDNVTTERKIYHVFHYFCDRVTNAPTSLHVDGVIILIIPLLCDYMEQYEKELQQ